MDEELFGLCREVYRRTGWGGTDFDYFKINKYAAWEIVPSKKCGYGEQEWQIAQTVTIYPLYTSDYLLEKLPAKLAYNKTEYFYYLEKFDDGSYGSGYGFTDEGGHIDHPMIGVLTDNVALKVNLKLVIALDDAGQLVAAETTA